MKKKIVWLVVSCLMVAALVLASCAPAVTEEEKKEVVKKEEVKKEEVVKKEVVVTKGWTPPKEWGVPQGVVVQDPKEPKYGGEFVGVLHQAPGTYDDCIGSPASAYTVHLTNDRLLIGDWAKGPAGTNETDFTQNIVLPQFQTGLVAESWEIPDPSNITIHVRKGMHFALNPNSEASRLVGGREVTAEDVAFSLNRAWTTPTAYGGKNYIGWVKSATATDKYTVKVKVNDTPLTPTVRVWEFFSGSVRIVPPEVVEKYKNMQDWRVSVGSGPFMLVDAVEGSAWTLKRNPDYWMKDPLHPQNQLPYLDGIKWLLIKDMSTRLAALRTHKIDYLRDINWEDGDMLIKSNPELQYLKACTDRQDCIYMRTDKPELPYKDIRVRRALSMAIDYKTIVEDFYGGNAGIVGWPLNPVFKQAYVPLEKLPQSSRELFEYHPDKAKQLLAEAGYPKGFKCTIITRGDPDYVDMLSIVADYWAKIGVELKIDVKETAVWKSIQMGLAHEDMFYYDQTFGQQRHSLSLLPGNVYNISCFNDPVVNECWAKQWAFENMGNADVENEMLRKIQLRGLDQAYVVQTPFPDTYTMWQPWVQNYHGEYLIGPYVYYNFPVFIWYDPNLKEAMTGR